MVALILKYVDNSPSSSQGLGKIYRVGMNKTFKEYLMMMNGGSLSMGYKYESLGALDK